ncbi:MAG: hypothetical protein CMG46_02630 [Candidatus Marinimicrobia bacterium]|nr:hypothetical protein [Candidatus Neomarinimicrobiota bacterium]|tara:strand:- start:806 stop:1249 length:444 start_codon:yes stop_codon:yes gene_type:complete
MGRGNKKGGKKHKRGKKDGFETKALRFKEDGQEYAQITACKGNCRFDVNCFDGKERIAILCGTMRKRKYVNLQDVVLVSLRDFQDDKCDIIDTYDDNQVRLLKDGKHIPESIQLGEESEFNEDLDGVEFTNDFPIEEDEGEIDLEEI